MLCIGSGRGGDRGNSTNSGIPEVGTSDEAASGRTTLLKARKADDAASGAAQMVQLSN